MSVHVPFRAYASVQNDFSKMPGPILKTWYIDEVAWVFGAHKRDFMLAPCQNMAIMDVV